MHYCYIVKCGEYVKIGYSKNMARRMEVLRTHNPHEPEVLALLPFDTELAAREREQWMHRLLPNCHVVREWFHADGVISFLQSDGPNKYSKHHRKRDRASGVPQGKGAW